MLLSGAAATAEKKRHFRKSAVYSSMYKVCQPILTKKKMCLYQKRDLCIYWPERNLYLPERDMYLTQKKQKKQAELQRYADILRSQLCCLSIGIMYAVCYFWAHGSWEMAHGNTLQHTATCFNMLYHAATQCYTLQHAATRCNTLHHAAPHCTTPQQRELEILRTQLSSRRYTWFVPTPSQKKYNTKMRNMSACICEHERVHMYACVSRDLSFWYYITRETCRFDMGWLWLVGSLKS